MLKQSKEARKVENKEYKRKRVNFGSASRLYSPGKWLWNWFMDTEYVAVGPPPWMWFLTLVAVVLFSFYLVSIYPAY